MKAVKFFAILAILALSILHSYSAPSAAASGPVTYQIDVRTDEVNGGGTDADVFITLFGTSRTGERRELETPHNDFERGHLDTFYITMEDVGSLYRIDLWHDNDGSHSQWCPAYVVVRNMATGQSWYFGIYRWLYAFRNYTFYLGNN